jgi:hypothetical protein
MVLVGPELAVGRVDDERDGAEFGMMWGSATAAGDRLGPVARARPVHRLRIAG